jgi:hypothetical protein
LYPISEEAKNRWETSKKRSNIDWKFPQPKAITLSMHLKSILHIPGHGKPDFS